jgi:hypothetical protein
MIFVTEVSWGELTVAAEVSWQELAIVAEFPDKNWLLWLSELRSSGLLRS